MSDIWIISDTHFGHSNIIKYCDRPFKSTEEMDEKLIENWNSVVKDGDKVYHLGDVYMSASKGYIENILSRLQGKKRLILGNHDNGKDQILQRYFQKIDVWRIFKEFGVVMTHIPLHESNITGKGKRNDGMQHEKLLNVHGHIHQNPSPDGPYRCVCVEKINYTPIHIEELRTT